MQSDPCAKVRLVGDAVYDQASLLPQIAAGVQLKSNDAHAVLHAIGAKSSRGADFYEAATKLFLAQSVLVNATVRLTKANQFGLLGFGGDRGAGYEAEFEGSLAYLFTRQLAVGAELRTKPNNLHFAHEGPAFDLFAAYFVNKHLSVTLAYVDPWHGRAPRIAERRLPVAAGRLLTTEPEENTMRLLPLLLAGALLVGRPPFARAELYDDLGGEAGMQAIVDHAVQRWMADPRVGPTFAETNMTRFRRLLTEQLCQVSGGPCRYTGRDMAAAHRALGLAQVQFNALAEDLQDAMGDAGVAYHTQNRLMARLAPMERDVVPQ